MRYPRCNNRRKPPGYPRQRVAGHTFFTSPIHDVPELHSRRDPVNKHTYGTLPAEVSHHRALRSALDQKHAVTAAVAFGVCPGSFLLHFAIGL
jgi:hypothetical protein